MSQSSLVHRASVLFPLALFAVAGPIAGAKDAPFLVETPPLVAACNAWRVHISDLLNQHWIAHEMDDVALSEIVRQFIAARNACIPGRYEVGLRMYEAIPLRRVQGGPK
jgi:hypothetical protein